MLHAVDRTDLRGYRDNGALGDRDILPRLVKRGTFFVHLLAQRVDEVAHLLVIDTNFVR